MSAASQGSPMSDQILQPHDLRHVAPAGMSPPAVKRRGSSGTLKGEGFPEWNEAMGGGVRGKSEAPSAAFATNTAAASRSRTSVADSEEAPNRKLTTRAAVPGIK
jgi:hypothetical protein